MIHGVINVHKEKGFTSHDVVAKLRGIIGQKKIGHTGTLDPDATGVLPVCLGKATKLCDMLTDKEKTYKAVMLLGVSTDTQDISGKVLEEKETNFLDEETVRTCILSFIGDYNQVPPMYSALKVNGKKLYELAREGKVVERKARPVNILDIQILKTELPRVTMEVTCSKGTYIRTLCDDIGNMLGCGACMESLVRTRVSGFELADSLTLEEVKQVKEEGRLERILTPIDAMFMQYNKVIVKREYASLLYNGNPFMLKHISEKQSFYDQENVRVYDENDTFIGIYGYEEEHRLFRIVKMFFDQSQLT